MSKADKFCIPTYIVNLKERPDRLSSILKEFENKNEFDIHIIEACWHEFGNVGLWNSFKKVIETANENNEDVILFVEDDHVFTENYDPNFFFQNIIEAFQQNADIVSGGIGGGFKYIVPITENRFWMNHFWCTQFIIIYKKFFPIILNAKFRSDDTLDNFLSILTTNKMVLFPFISIQKNFGYSDITDENSKKKNITSYFDSSNLILSKYHRMLKKHTR